MKHKPVKIPKTKPRNHCAEAGHARRAGPMTDKRRTAKAEQKQYVADQTKIFIDATMPSDLDDLDDA